MSYIKPLYLLAGGDFNNPVSMVPLISDALAQCGREKPTVAYLGVANGDSENFFNSTKTLLLMAGAREVPFVRLASDTADPACAKRTLSAADAIFISGGEVEDGMRWLEKHGLVEYLKDLRSQGKFFLGVSAGSIMMGTHWVRWDDPDDDATAELFDCLGFIPTTYDTHAEDEDWKELKMALKLQGSGACGYGIPRGGLLRVDSKGNMESFVKTLLCYVNNNGQVMFVPGENAGRLNAVSGGKHGV